MPNLKGIPGSFSQELSKVWVPYYGTSGGIAKTVMQFSRCLAGHDRAFGFRGAAPIGRMYSRFAGVPRMLCVR